MNKKKYNSIKKVIENNYECYNDIESCDVNCYFHDTRLFYNCLIKKQMHTKAIGKWMKDWSMMVSDLTESEDAMFERFKNIINKHHKKMKLNEILKDDIDED